MNPVIITIILIHRAYDTLQTNFLEEEKHNNNTIWRTFLTTNCGAQVLTQNMWNLHQLPWSSKRAMVSQANILLIYHFVDILRLLCRTSVVLMFLCLTMAIRNSLCCSFATSTWLLQKQGRWRWTQIFGIFVR